MRNELLPLLSGEVLDEDLELTLSDLCRVCRLPAEQVFELVEEGIVEPLGRDASCWRFHESSWAAAVAFSRAVSVSTLSVRSNAC